MLKVLTGIVAALILAPVAARAADKAPADANKLFPDSKVVVRDRFSVEVVGKGPDVVLIPGLSSSRATWASEAARLKKTHRLHLVQIAGFAGEPARANATGEVFAPTAEAIDAYIVETKLGPATVVGHSLGGSMALWLAQHHPEHLKKVMIVDSAPFLAQMMMGARATPESVKPTAAMIRDNMSKGGEGYAAGLKQQISRMATSDASKQTVTDWGLVTDPSVAGRAFYELLILDQRPGMATTKTPLTVVYPDNTPAGGAAAFMDQVYAGAYKAAPAVALRRVDKSLHFVMFDQPEAFAKEMDAFLAN